MEFCSLKPYPVAAEFDGAAKFKGPPLKIYRKFIAPEVTKIRAEGERPARREPERSVPLVELKGKRCAGELLIPLLKSYFSL